MKDYLKKWLTNIRLSTIERILSVICWCFRCWSWTHVKGCNERIKNGILGRATRWGRERAPACFDVHTRGHTSVETMCLEVLIADVILICTHPRRHTRQGRHYGPAPQESALLWHLERASAASLKRTGARARTHTQARTRAHFDLRTIRCQRGPALHTEAQSAD